MQEDSDIKISMLLDGELEPQEALEILTRIRNESALRAKWLRYNAASCACKGNSAIVPDYGFLERVSKALDAETQLGGLNGFSRRKPPRITSIVVALAASVAVVGVMLWSGVPASINTLSNDVLPVSLVFPPQKTEQRIPVISVKSKPDRSPASPRRLNDYLITHNESTYSTDAQTMMPFARVVTYSYDR